MASIEKAALLGGVFANRQDTKSSPTNLHIISGEVAEKSEDGTVSILMDGVVYSAEDSQYIEMDTFGGLEEGDSATILLSGENGYGMTPLVLGSIGSVDRVADAAAAAWEYADQAHEAAESAQESADSASESAVKANLAANSALTQLSVVEDVAGTLDWISKHGTYELTIDTSIVEGTVYFELVDGEYVPISNPPTGANPSENSWYTLDVTDSQSDYIMAHLAVTSAGLWVLPSGIGEAVSERYANGYKVLLSNSGMQVYDSNGVLVVTYGSTITFDTSRPFAIGDTSGTNYIAFTPSGGVIIGSGVTIGGDKTITQLISDVDTAVEQATEAIETALDGATLFISSTNGNLFKNGSESTILQVAIFPNGGGRLDTITAVRERFGVNAYIEWKWRHDESGTWGTIASNDSHISHDGMWLTITPTDVATKTSFEASLIVP